MINRHLFSRAGILWAILGLAPLFLVPGAGFAQGVNTSQLMTLTCTGSPCPWGPTLSGQAIAWPASRDPISVRLGYTASQPGYLPASSANGAVIELTSGTAAVYAGLPASQTHRRLTTIGAGGVFQVAGLQAGEVLSVQSASTFKYKITLPAPPPPPSEPTSEYLTANCTGSPCPSGPVVFGHVLVWPVSAQASSRRLGYTVSKPIYLSAYRANTGVVWINSGSATLYAGRPQATEHRVLATLTAGQFHTVTGLAADEVLSVQGPATFTYSIALPDVPPEEPGVTVNLVKAYWRCNTPGCTDPDWTASAISWPSWSAYSTNARSGSSSRTVYAENGELLYTYMGSWANGCDVTVVTGAVLIVEWERGTDNWRQTYLSPGDRYVINLLAPENGAQIEGLNNSSVQLRSCTPQPLE